MLTVHMQALAVGQVIQVDDAASNQLALGVHLRQGAAARIGLVPVHGNDRLIGPRDDAGTLGIGLHAIRRRVAHRSLLKNGVVETLHFSGGRKQP